MVKVNNGWQSNSIDEVESLVSQKASPASSTSTIYGRLTSPRTAIANVQGHTDHISSTNAPIADFDLYSRADQPSRTYESFWRDHSTSSYPNQRQTGMPMGSSPPLKTLAPPADIRQTVTSRRSNTPRISKPPSIPGRGSNSPYHSTAPRTPHRAEFGERIQTPTHKTIQEQDAIESLLFMSSPGNSGNMGHTFPPPRTQGSPQQSPLRAEFMTRGPPGRRVEFEQSPPSMSNESSETGGVGYGSQIRRGPMNRYPARGEDVDRMLDEMGDSSSDEELVLTYTNSRVAAGRV